MNKKQILSFFLSLSLVLTILVVPTAAAFSDVPSSAWYAQDVAAVQKYGILEGTGNGKFSPDGNLTLAQAITMAARTYAYSNHETIPQTGGSAWYSDYIQYAAEKGICAAGEFGTAYDNYCNRLTMAKLFARVVPAGTGQAINDVTSLPDVQSVPENQAVFDLYQLGILTGSDKYGTFHPYQYIKRSETAAILNRVLAPENRKTVTLETPPSMEDIYTAAILQAWEHFSDEISYSPYDLGDFAIALYDIDGNGVQELLVGFTNDPECVYAVYTIQDYHAVCLLLGVIPAGTTSSNAPYYLLGDGIIEHSWFGGAFSHGITYYKIRNGASLAVTESWTFEYNENPAKQYFYSTTSDDYYSAPSAFRPVTQSFVQNVNAKYGDPLTIQYTPVF